MTEEPRTNYSISLVNDQSRHVVNDDALTEAVRAVLQQSEFATAEISLAIVDDDTMRELNRRFLNHDWPTDVLSFPLSQDGGQLIGEVVISADTAAATAAELGWEAQAEQLLYVIHGMLHLIGFSDKSPDAREQMQAAEDRLLSRFGLSPPRPGTASRGVIGVSNQRTPAGARRP